MKVLFGRILARWKLFAGFLAGFGVWGVGLGALLDSSSIPIPMDALLAVYIWGDKPHFWLYCLMAAAASAVGGLVPYGLGRAGGEIFLLKRINRQRFDELRIRFERQEFLAMVIPSLLPPPTPWKMFVFAAGVFEMRIVSFMAAVFMGRTVRWLILSLLVLKLGPGAVALIEHHALSGVAVVCLAAFLGFVLWWRSKRRAGQLG